MNVWGKRLPNQAPTRPHTQKRKEKKRKNTCEKLKGEHPEAPDVDRLGVRRAAHENLGRGVLGGPAHGFPAVEWGGRVHSPAEVRQLESALAIQEEILGLIFFMDRPIEGLVRARTRDGALNS